MRALDPGKARARGERLLRHATERAIQRFVHGVVLFLDGEATPTGVTPRQKILEEGKLSVFRYLPPEPEDLYIGTEVVRAERRRHPVPLLLIPPLMVRPYVFDLRPEHSLVKFLLREGFDVFLVDFGVPGKGDEGVRLDHYVCDYLPAAISAVREESGREELSLVGYCMGGLFALCYTAAHEDPGIRNIATVASPIDFHRMGVISLLALTAHRPADLAIRAIGNIPGFLSSTGFKLLRPWHSFIRYFDLAIRLWDEEYVRGYDAMNRYMNDFIPYPAEALRQLLRDFMMENGLRSQIAFRDKIADLAKLRCSLLALTGSGDDIAPEGSTSVIQERVGSTDVELAAVPGGHLGVIVGSKAPQTTWRIIADWLAARSSGQVSVVSGQ
jgi:polyhydroxyalkanoate synthase subunit PhaC